MFNRSRNIGVGYGKMKSKALRLKFNFHKFLFKDCVIRVAPQWLQALRLDDSAPRRLQALMLFDRGCALVVTGA